MSPLTVSAVTVLEDKDTNVVSPIPLNAFKSTAELLTRPDPLIEPLAAVIVT